MVEALGGNEVVIAYSRDFNVRDKGNALCMCQSPGPDKLYSVSGSMFFVPLFVWPAHVILLAACLHCTSSITQVVTNSHRINMIMISFAKL